MMELDLDGIGLQIRILQAIHRRNMKWVYAFLAAKIDAKQTQIFCRANDENDIISEKSKEIGNIFIPGWMNAARSKVKLNQINICICIIICPMLFMFV